MKKSKVLKHTKSVPVSSRLDENPWPNDYKAIKSGFLEWLYIKDRDPADIIVTRDLMRALLPFTQGYSDDWRGLQNRDITTGSKFCKAWYQSLSNLVAGPVTLRES